MGAIFKKSELIHLFMIHIKKSKNLPFKILTDVCPDHKNNCKKHHEEILITSYNRKTKKFHLKYYAMHERGVKFQIDQPIDFVRELIFNFLQTRKRTMNVNYLKKFLNKDPFKPRKIRIVVRYNTFEYKILKKKALLKNLDLATYIRKRSVG